MNVATGLVWIVVGLLLWVVPPLLVNRPLYVRGTAFPWGLAVAAVGVVVLMVAWVRGRRRGRSGHG